MGQAEYDAIVIGAGCGGISCGSILAKNGLKTLILEQNNVVGGCCSTFEDEGFHFDTGASNGPVEAINGRLEHLRGIALGFRNLNHYILRSLIHSGGLQAKINAL